MKTNNEREHRPGREKEREGVKDSGTNSIEIPRGELDRLLAHADGNAALLYLQIRRAGSYSLDRAARELKCTAEELRTAAGVLRAMELLESPEQTAERTLEREAPEYTAEDVSALARTDIRFQAAVSEAERVLGRVLSSNDLKLLFGIYDYWGLQADVILLLLNHCVEKYQARCGPGRKPTMRYVEKEAQYWAKMEIHSLDAAEALIQREKEKQTLLRQSAEAMNIRRELTPTERKYLESWIDLGFGPEAVAIAYDRTMVGAGKLAWRYMDKIFRNWDEKKLHTPEEIEAGDGPDRRPEPAASRRSPPERWRTSWPPCAGWRHT